MKLLTTGSQLRLHSNQKLYEIVGFGFEIADDTGSWWHYIELRTEEGEIQKTAAWMVLECLKDGLMYPPSSDGFMRELHNARASLASRSEGTEVRT